MLFRSARLRRLSDEDGMIARARKDIAALIVELDGTVDRNVTIAESTLSELKTALAEADRRIALLARDKPMRPVAQDTPPQDMRPAAQAASRYRAEQASFPPAASVQPRKPGKSTGDDQAYAFSGVLPDASLEAEKLSVGAANAAQAAAAISSPDAGIPVGDGPVLTERPSVGTDGSSQGLPFVRLAARQVPIEEPFPDRVLALYRKGMSAELIASNLSAPVSEVEIVIAMEDGRSRRRGDA